MVSTPMALARAFTKRVKRNNETLPTRDKHQTKVFDRNLISLPTELISTTNVHALTAPDISSLQTSSTSSVHSGNDSDFSLGTPILSPAGDTSSIDSSPTTPTTPELGEMRLFFDISPIKRSTTTASPRTSGSVTILDAPVLPKRALSHSKKAHIELSRKRSLQRLSPPPMSLPQAGHVRDSSDFLSVNGDHPFLNELAQVNEVAEEFGLTSFAEEEKEMQSKGLMKFGADAYMDEIAGLYGGIFEDQLGLEARPRA